MSYGKFALVYDSLMKNAPYGDWARFVKGTLDTHAPNAKRILDVGCGTGELANRLLENDYEVVGVDLSEEMLMIAQEKTAGKIPLFMQDMRELEGLGEFDCVAILCDSLNYLDNLSEVKETFIRVKEHLVDDGIFIFDVHSVLKFKEQFNDKTYAESGEDINFIWNAWEGDEENSVIHDMSFFVLDEESGMYERFDEEHYQKTFEVEQYKAVIAESGFELLEVLGDFGTSDVKHADRVFFICYKK